MFSRLFSKSKSKSKSTKTTSNKTPRVFTIDYRRGYNNATHNIKNYWP